jgi:hypothetical protein
VGAHGARYTPVLSRPMRLAGAFLAPSLDVGPLWDDAEATSPCRRLALLKRGGLTALHGKNDRLRSVGPP